MERGSEKTKNATSWRFALSSLMYFSTAAMRLPGYIAMSLELDFNNTYQKGEDT